MVKFFKIEGKGYILINKSHKLKIKIITCKNKIIHHETKEEFKCMFPISLPNLLKVKNWSICNEHWKYYAILYNLYNNGIVKIEDMCLHCVTCTCEKCDDKYNSGILCEVCGKYKYVY